MYKLIVQSSEKFNEQTGEFVYIPQRELNLEHSLISVSKWESKWRKPFLDNDKMTKEQTLDYIKCMTITQNVPDIVYYGLTSQQIDEINKYINSPMTATWFNEDKRSKSRNSEAVTSELIYYWMVANNIPLECEKWHLNRLLTLIRICGIKNAPPKKMSKKEIMNRNRSLNEARKKALGTRG